MTEIKASAQNHAVHTPDDVRPYYAGMDDNPRMPGAVPKIGVEIEHTLYNPADLSLPNSVKSEAMVARGAADGLPVHHEPTAACLEIVTDPFPVIELYNLLEQMEARNTYLMKMAADHGFTISPFGHMPHLRAEDHQVVNKERFQTFFAPPRGDMDALYRSFFDCMDIQVSASYHDDDHLLRIIRMALALEPLSFLSTDSNAGFYEGQPLRYSLRIALKAQRGINGGHPDFYFTAKTGAEFIEEHLNFTLNRPYMFAYFDFEHRLRKLPEGQYVAFNDLERLNLGPRDLVNFRQAESESWRLAGNIAMIDDPQGQLIGHRAELASFQTGLMHQRASAALMANLIAFDEGFYDQTAALLRAYGIDLDDLAGCRDILTGNFKAAVYHENKFSEVPFGTGTLGAFARSLADIVEGRYTATPFELYIAPLLHIWRSGRPDWLVYREKFETLADVKAYLTSFPHCAADNPDLLSAQSCADWALHGCPGVKRAA